MLVTLSMAQGLGPFLATHLVYLHVGLELE